MSGALPVEGLPAGYTRVGPGFAPVFDENAGAGALILGSFPSPKSREQGFYYGHPQNRFWPLLAALCGEPAPDRGDIAAKRALILRHYLALWDVLERCAIRGASDASIREAVPNDVAALVRRLGVRTVFCGGAAAGRLYARYIEPDTRLPAVVLPSTSPANAAWSFARLQSVWGPALAPWLG